MNEHTDYLKSLTDDKCDPDLGHKVYEHLRSLGLETWTGANYDPEFAVQQLQEGVRNAIYNLGLPIDDPSLRDTPKRFACMVVGELTKGLNYDLFPKCTATPNGEPTEWYQERKLPQEPVRYKLSELEEGVTLSPTNIPVSVSEQVRKGGTNEMVAVYNIETISLCEHHWQTIDGYTHIAYIPKTKILGLSKFARVTDFFARRPQIQERMTEQIFAALSLILETDDIAVVQKAQHYCMKARGALQRNSQTQTNKMGGRFMSNEALRKEFIDGIV